MCKKQMALGGLLRTTYGHVIIHEITYLTVTSRQIGNLALILPFDRAYMSKLKKDMRE